MRARNAADCCESMADAAQTRSERDQLELFRALPGDLAPRDAQDLMAYPFFSLAKTKRIVPIDFRAGAIAIRVEAVPNTAWRRSGMPMF